MGLDFQTITITFFSFMAIVVILAIIVLVKIVGNLRMKLLRLKLLLKLIPAE
jgi:hypothetical protein